MLRLPYKEPTEKQLHDLDNENRLAESNKLATGLWLMVTHGHMARNGLFSGILNVQDHRALSKSSMDCFPLKLKMSTLKWRFNTPRF